MDIEEVRMIILKHLDTYKSKPGMRIKTKICKSYHISDLSFYRAVDVLIDRNWINVRGNSNPKYYNITESGIGNLK